MRWDGQKINDERQGALPGFGEFVRTVRTPEFSGLVFHEVRAKSVLNRVPSSSSMPFGWTVNPYRGCSHACAYCLGPDTPILMADGRTRPISELRVGDRIYGTKRRGTRRRYVPTTVLAHWSTTKPGYRVTLADGTELVTSGDHRFLSERGWKHVAKGHQRSYLTPGTRLMGTGRFAEQPDHTPDYRRGYLAGMIRVDLHLTRHRSDRPGGFRYYSFLRPATLDVDALDRVAEYLDWFSVPTTRFAFSQGPSGQPVTAIGTGQRAHAQTIGRLVEWPSVPSDAWSKGFLAGIFDAEGKSTSDGLLIRHADPAIIEAVALALKHFEFDFAVEDAAEAGGPRTVRLHGGLSERLRFLHITDPAAARKRSIEHLTVESGAGLDIVSIEPLELDLPMFDITTGTGDFIADGVVSHNCFARNSHTYLDFDAGQDFNTQVVVKVNAPEVLAAQLRRPSWQREHVAMGTNTDPYQRAEGRYELMPRIISALAGSGTPFSILTKGTVLSRDIPLLASAGKDVSVGVGVSIALIDRELQRTLEPGTPSPQARLELVRRVRAAGLPCGVFVAPVLPGLTDSIDQLDRLLAAIADAGATGVTVLPLHLRPGTREWFARWLAEEHPELVDGYRSLYARGSYVDKRYNRWLGARVGPLLRRHGLDKETLRAAEQAESGRSAVPEQRSDEPDGQAKATGRWPAGSLPAGAPESFPVDQEQLTLL